MSVRERKATFRKAHSRGVALIFTAGFLTIMAALGMSFYVMTRSGVNSAVRYSDSVRAEWNALAGIHDGIARIRQLVRQETETPNADWYMTNDLRGAQRRTSFCDRSSNGIDDDGDGLVDEADEAALSFTRRMRVLEGVLIEQFQQEITDAQSRINLNAGDNLATILNNLCHLIGPPLVAADQDLLQPRRWFVEGASAAYDTNPADVDPRVNPAAVDDTLDIYFKEGANGQPLTWSEYQAKHGGVFAGKPGGEAVYGDGYAIAAYRAKYGSFGSLDDVKNALTYIERNGNNERDDALEILEVEAKFAALRPYITLASWVDTNTVGVGKFEWAVAGVTIRGESCDLLIDRDKSWVADDPNDTLNERGSLRGSYVSIVNGHGAGQFRRIFANGADWIALKRSEHSADDAALALLPGPISSYMIVAREDATPDPYDPNNGIAANRMDFAPVGDLQDHPNIDYSVRPLCIHRAPVNMNTASGIVLTALFMGINVQHGHPLAIGTDADADALVKVPLAAAGATDWRIKDSNLRLESYLLTPRGLKRIPAASGELVFNRNLAAFMTKYSLSSPDYNLDYLNQTGSLWGTDRISEAHELAIRVMVARQRTKPVTVADPDPILQVDLGGNYERGAFRDWDDFYFRVIRPFDDARLAEDDLDGVWNKVPLSKMLMAHFNNNTDLLKFNPNIEWIDRWGRNFTEMEPVMIFAGGAPKTVAQPWAVSRPAGAPQGSYLIRSLRYASSEMIDKSDLNRSTTEFSFDSSGTFEIVSTGQVIQPITGQLLAERKLETIVKVYDVWRESTQRQFVRGRFSAAARANRNGIQGVTGSGFTDAGRRSRDNDPWDAASEAFASGAMSKALDTLPEPLVPLNFVLRNPNGLSDYVDTAMRDVWGNAKPGNAAAGIAPDIIANRVFPASYDGQLVLAANTANYTTGGDTKDTFLASFDGDPDTDTSAGNGREQAKAPRNCRVRVADSIGLLGVMNDQEIDTDPDNTPGDLFVTAVSELPGLPLTEMDPITGTPGVVAWWHNQSVRMGDLRTDGMFMGAMGTSLKEGSLKYPMGDFQTAELGFPNPGAGVEPNPPPNNFYPGSPDGFTVSLWFKPNWRGADGREHVFFDATMLGDDALARYCHLYKAGRFSFARRTYNGSSDKFERNNCLTFGAEDLKDEDFMSFLHGGTKNVTNLPMVANAETPSYYVQPFRWGYVGAKFRYEHSCGATPPTSSIKQTPFGFWHSSALQTWVNACLTEIGHAFINSQRYPEGPTWTPSNYWMYWVNYWDTLHDRMQKPDLRGQPAAYSWANHATPTTTRRKGVFSVCNVNESGTSWIYRSTPIDGTYSVIDELRLTKQSWESNRIAAEMTTSRYYLPGNPALQTDCPYFLSQPMLKSLKGQGVSSTGESVELARVGWTVFTPRFLHEYKEPGTYSHTQFIKGAPVNVDNRGPFDYAQYNRDVDYDRDCGWKDIAVNAPREWLGVKRPVPVPNTQSHYTQGVEVELWNGATVADRVAGQSWDPTTKTFMPASTFTDPAMLNTFPEGTRANAGQLRYCVRFRYPVSRDVDFNGGAQWLANEHGQPTVNPAKHYLLDTPVFDDISVTYITRVRFLQYLQVSE